jgi:mono/diheme cytochrome c family protein
MFKKIPFLILATVLLLAACSAGGSSGTDEAVTLAPVPTEYAGLTNPLGADAAAQGARVFHTSCEPCHGPQGHGDGPAGQGLDPKPRNLAVVQAAANDDFLFWRINEGKPGTAMVPWKGILTDDQIWQVISFIRTLKP